MLTSDKLEAIRKEVNDELATLRGGDGRSHRFARMASELLGHIHYLEARAVVVPEPTHDEFMALAESSRIHGDLVDFMAGAAAYGLWLRGKIRAIPADRVLVDGMAALRRFAERCAQRDHQPDEHIGSAKCVACEAEDALRANQGGAAT